MAVVHRMNIDSLRSSRVNTCIQQETFHGADFFQELVEVLLHKGIIKSIIECFIVFSVESPLCEWQLNRSMEA
jgi:hypothetical protein